MNEKITKQDMIELQRIMSKLDRTKFFKVNVPVSEYLDAFETFDELVQEIVEHDMDDIFPESASKLTRKEQIEEYNKQYDKVTDEDDLERFYERQVPSEMNVSKQEVQQAYDFFTKLDELGFFSGQFENEQKVFEKMTDILHDVNECNYIGLRLNKNGVYID